MLARKKEAVVEPSESEVIGCGQTAAQAVIKRHVDALKASSAGSGLPRESLLQMTMQGSSCVCAVAHHLLSKENKQ
jgi:hypothetical protein